MITTQRKPSAYDAFVHLVTYFAMVLSAIAVGGIIFQIINRFVPDLETMAYLSPDELVHTGPLRFQIASLLLVLPLFLAMTAYVHRLFAQGALDIVSGVRRWLTYLLLFAAAVNIVGSVISLVYQFLGGNYTANFLLKATTVLVIAAGIFVFYFWELRRADFRTRHPAAVTLFVILAVAYVGLLVSGFLLIGSPRQARQREFDRRRVDAALQAVGRVEETFRTSGAVPVQLEVLGPDVGRDPQNGSLFPYEKLADHQYRLCVTFSLAAFPRPGTRAPAPAKPYSGNTAYDVWQQHTAGEQCHTFTLSTVSPDRNFITTQVDNGAPAPTPTPSVSP